MHCCTVSTISKETDTFEDLLTQALGVLWLIKARLQERLRLCVLKQGPHRSIRAAAGRKLDTGALSWQLPHIEPDAGPLGQLLSGAAVLCPENTDHLCYEMAFVCNPDTCWILNLKILLTIILFFF